jgi:hypothetical protein
VAVNFNGDGRGGTAPRRGRRERRAATFVIMLGSLVIAASLILLVAHHTYPRDVATAMAAELLTTSAAEPDRTVQTTGKSLLVADAVV